LLDQNNEGFGRPVSAYITYQTIDGYIKAMDEFSLKTQSAGDNYGGLIILKATGSPHSIIWENRFVPFSHQVKVGTLFLLFIMFYLFLITKLMDFSRFYFESLNSNYAMLS